MKCFKYICRVLPDLTIEKLKAGIFDGPPIRKLLKDTHLVKVMSENEASDWLEFIKMPNFHEKYTNENYKDLFTNLISTFRDTGANVSI